MFGGFALCTKSPNIFAGKYLCAPGGRKGRPYGKTIVFTTPVHFCNTPYLVIRKPHALAENRGAWGLSYR
jgi:hypothetical protein